MNELTTVTIDSIRNKVKATKAKSTMRYYLAMLSRLEKYAQSSTIDLNKVNPEFVSGFGDYLARAGVTPATAKLFQMSLRAVLKEEYGKDNSDRFRSTFKNLGSYNNAKTSTLSFNELVAIKNLNLEQKSALWKARAVFMYCVYGAAISFESLQAKCSDNESVNILPQQKRIITEFEKRYATGFFEFVSHLDANQYSKLIAGVGTLANTASTLAPDSVTEAWISAAHKYGLSADLIAQSVATENDYTRAIKTTQKFDEQEISQAIKAVANQISDETPHWYVMKCHGRGAAETELHILQKASFLQDESFKTFHVSTNKTTKYKPTGNSFIESMLFFQCTAENAAKIKQFISKDAFVYTLIGSSTPAYISVNEMRTFMLLSEISSSDLDYYFPEEKHQQPAITTGDTAKIVYGDYTGHVGIVKKLMNDEYRVQIEFKSLGGFRVTATVPIRFLKFD